MKMRNMFTTGILAAAVMAMPSFAADTSEEVKEAGTAIKNDVAQAADTAGDKMEKAADKTGRALDNAADTTERKMDHAADKADRKMDHAADKTAHEAHDAKQAVKHDMNHAQVNADGHANAGMLALPAGFKIDGDSMDRAEDLRGTLTSSISAVLTKGGFDDLVERFVDQDRNRIGADNIDDDTLNTAVDMFRANWKTKYGHDFELDRENMFTQMNVVSGEVTDGQVAMTHWPLKVQSPMGGAMDTVAPAKVTTGDKAEDAEERREDANLENGRDVAVARVTADASKNQQLTLSFIDELGGWKLDLPNNITGTSLRASLSKCLDGINGMAAQWPADEAQAKNVVAGKILMAIYGIDASK